MIKNFPFFYLILSVLSGIICQ